MGFRVLLSVAVLSSCFMINVLGGGFDPDHVSWTQAPHHSPSYPPTGAPAPHHRHPKRPGGHHHKPAVPPTAHTPTVAPVHPPTVAPVHPPKVAPVHPPKVAPVHPPKVAPVHPPKVAPVHPPKVAPVHPPKVAPVHPPKVAPVHPPRVAPVHPPKVAPVHPPKVAPVHPPKVAPVHPPTVAPVHPPTKAPVHPPAPSHSPLPTRRQVAVRGMVYCKACKYKGIDTLMAATPLPGAVVLLTCRNTKYPLRVKATTDKNGFFFIMPPKTLTTYGAHKCKVTVLSSPQPKCSQATNLHYGLKGAILIPTPRPVGSGLVAPPLPYDVFTVGPFAFEAPKKTHC